MGDAAGAAVPEQARLQAWPRQCREEGPHAMHCMPGTCRGWAGPGAGMVVILHSTGDTRPVGHASETSGKTLDPT